jgi:hypothetical protein
VRKINRHSLARFLKFFDQKFHKPLLFFPPLKTLKIPNTPFHSPPSSLSQSHSRSLSHHSHSRSLSLKNTPLSLDLSLISLPLLSLPCSPSLSLRRRLRPPAKLSLPRSCLSHSGAQNLRPREVEIIGFWSYLFLSDPERLIMLF